MFTLLTCYLCCPVLYISVTCVVLLYFTFLATFKMCTYDKNHEESVHFVFKRKYSFEILYNAKKVQ